jgi:hypothetical protein
MKCIDWQEWFLIDFDDACQSSSATAYTRMAVQSHALEIPLGSHDKSVDMWSVGYLITSAGSKDFKVNNYAKKLMHGNPQSRPTADEALQWLKKTFSSYIS